MSRVVAPDLQLQEASHDAATFKSFTSCLTATLPPDASFNVDIAGLVSCLLLCQRQLLLIQACAPVHMYAGSLPLQGYQNTGKTKYGSKCVETIT